MKKKILSIFLTVCLLVGCVPPAVRGMEVATLYTFWKEFVSSEKYKNATTVKWKDQIAEYALLDIDGNGSEELILSTHKDSLGFANYTVFEYDEDKGEVKTVEIESQYTDEQYSLGDQYNNVIRYSPIRHALVYQELRNGMQMADWGYWNLVNRKLEISCRLMFDATGKGNPVYRFIENDKRIDLTEEQYRTYIMEDTEIVDFFRIEELTGKAFELQQEFYFQDKHIATINLPESWEGHVVTEKDNGFYPRYFPSITFYSRLNKKTEYGGRLFTIQMTSGDDWKNMPRKTWLKTLWIDDIRYEIILWGPTDVRYDHDDPACREEWLLMEGGEQEIIDNIVFHIGTNDVSSFVDVPTNAYYYKAACWAKEKEVMVGDGKGHLTPEKGCTRAEVVQVLKNLSGESVGSSGSSFTDVPNSAWYSAAVEWAVANGITSGTGGGKFSPDQKCTRAQIVTFLWNYAGKPTVSSGSSFNDVRRGEYYENAVKWAVANGITSGTGNGKFSPNATCTRGQIVTFLYKYAG